MTRHSSRGVVRILRDRADLRRSADCRYRDRRAQIRGGVRDGGVLGCGCE